ncbi:MAG: hypothetical protein IK083_07445, partial [Abditibacteriota bacterium]|nr:hypothetical protein [Abditibacteriota bacterium]
MSKDNLFDWVTFYKELAGKLLDFKYNRMVLTDKIRLYCESQNVDIHLLEIDGRFADIDPFTVFGLFNRKIDKDARAKSCICIKELFGIEAPAPTDFDTIPDGFGWITKYYNSADDIYIMWDLYEIALEYSADPNPGNRAAFADIFDRAMAIKGNGKGTITPGLFWIAPDSFLALNNMTVSYIYDSLVLPGDLVGSLPDEQIVSKSKVKSGIYLDLMDKLRDYFHNEESIIKSFKDLNIEAWCFAEGMPSLVFYDEGKEIVKITMESGSGYFAEEYYEDSLTITADSINYKYNPLHESEYHKPYKWAYKSRSAAFKECFEKAAIAVRLILRTAGCFANDAGTLSFIVKYDDNSTRERTFCGKFDFGEFF